MQTKHLQKNYTFIILYRIKTFLFLYLQRCINLIYFNLIKVTTKFIKSVLIILPKKIKKFSVVRSPTTSKLSKEQFEFRLYSCCIFFYFECYLEKLLINFFLIRLKLYLAYNSIQIIKCLNKY